MRNSANQIALARSHNSNRALHVWLLVVLAGALLLPRPAVAQTYSNKPGMAAAQFLRIGVAARGAALGDAITASVNDATATFYNPSGLLHVDKFDAVASQTQFPADVGISFASVAARLTSVDVIGVSALLMDSGEMKVRTVLQPDGTGETFKTVNMAVGLSYARYITDRLRAGLTGRFIRMMPVTGVFEKNSWSLDVGIQYETGLSGAFSGLVIGMTVTSFGPQIAFVRETYGLPLTYSVALSKPVAMAAAGDLLAVVNWQKAMDASEEAQVGLEYGFQNTFFLRGGYKFATQNAQSWTGGFGIEVPVREAEFRVDYAYSDFGPLGAQHRVTLGIGM